MKKDRVREAFLDHLRRVPIIEVCCEKVNVSRMSIDRWRKADKEFDKAVVEAMNQGDAFMNDLSESQLISLIKDKHWPAISFWLKARNPKFRDRIEITAHVKRDAMTPEENAEFQAAVERALINAPFLAGKSPPGAVGSGEEKDSQNKLTDNNNQNGTESKQQ